MLKYIIHKYIDINKTQNKILILIKFKYKNKSYKS